MNDKMEYDIHPHDEDQRSIYSAHSFLVGQNNFGRAFQLFWHYVRQVIIQQVVHGPSTVREEPGACPDSVP